MNTLRKKKCISHIKYVSRYIIIGSLLLSALFSIIKAIRNSQVQYQTELNSLLTEHKAAIRKFHTTGQGHFIAHGGGINQYLYTNSKEAVENALSKGFRFIELDLQKTNDSHLLAAHDWKHFGRLTGQSGIPANLDDALKLKINGGQSPLSGKKIHELLRQYPDWYLVTDKITDFDLLLREIPRPERMIVEVFSPQDYIRALKAGVHYPAFSVPHQAALRQACVHGYPMIAIGAELFLNNIETMRQLHRKGVCIMVFGTEAVNLARFVEEHAGTAASMFYISTEPPATLSPG